MYIEPNSDARQMASVYREFFNAFVEKGFSEEQALELIKTLIAGAFTANGN